MKTKNYTFPCQYYVLDVPPGCRKPRPMLHTDEITVHVPVVTPDEAPVACVYSPDAPITAENMPALIDAPECAFRYFNGSFYRHWTLCQHWGPQEVTEADCLEHFLGSNVIAVPKESSDALAKFAADEAGLFFILDGDKPQVWAKVDEPCWAVQTEAKGKNPPKVTLEFTSLGKYSFPKFGANETNLAKRFVKILADRNHFSCEAELVKDHLVVLMPEVFRGNVME